MLLDSNCGFVCVDHLAGNPGEHLGQTLIHRIQPFNLSSGMTSHLDRRPGAMKSDKNWFHPRQHRFATLPFLQSRDVGHHRLGPVCRVVAQQRSAPVSRRWRRPSRAGSSPVSASRRFTPVDRLPHLTISRPHGTKHRRPETDCHRCPAAGSDQPSPPIDLGRVRAGDWGNGSALAGPRMTDDSSPP